MAVGAWVEPESVIVHQSYEAVVSKMDRAKYFFACVVDACIIAQCATG